MKRLGVVVVVVMALTIFMAQGSRDAQADEWWGGWVYAGDDACWYSWESGWGDADCWIWYEVWWSGDWPDDGGGGFAASKPLSPESAAVAASEAAMLDPGHPCGSRWLGDAYVKMETGSTMWKMEVYGRYYLVACENVWQSFATCSPSTWGNWSIDINWCSGWTGAWNDGGWPPFYYMSVGADFNTCGWAYGFCLVNPSRSERRNVDIWGNKWTEIYW